jgi:putative transposase
MRKPRAWEEGRAYHLTPAGNAGRAIFVDDVDREKFLTLTGPIASTYEVTIIGYCLMGTHVHLLVVSGPGGLSRFVQVLLTRFARWFNRRHGSEGHVFENHFHATDVLTDSHLSSAARYVDLNPVEAGLVERPEEWRWSSYRAHVGLEAPAAFLANDAFLAYFGPTRARATAAYREFVEQGRASTAVSDTVRAS